MRKGRARWRVETLGQIATYGDDEKAPPRSFDPQDLVGYEERVLPRNLDAFWDEHCTCPNGVAYVRDDLFDEVAEARCRGCGATAQVSMLDYAIRGLPQEVNEDG